jgi:hypothetical protein
LDAAKKRQLLSSLASREAFEAMVDTEPAKVMEGELA